MFVIAVRTFILSPIVRAARFQVTDEFIAQLPQHLIVSSSHLQLLESIGEGKLLDLTWNLYMLGHIIYTRYIPCLAQAPTMHFITCSMEK